MKIKTFHAGSVESAIRRARLEMGEEAVLLDSRKTTPEEPHLGAYEVRFAMTAEQPGAETAAPAPAAPDRLEQLEQSVEEIRRMLASYTRTSYLPSGQMLSQPELGRLYQELAANDLEPALAAELVASLIPEGERGASRAQLERRLVGELESRVPVAAELGRAGARPQVAALVGPAGAGKTVTAAKLAVRCGLGQKRRVSLITTDIYRIGAVDQLRRLASILGAEVTVAEDPAQLEAALDGFRRAREQAPELVLIDTPGRLEPSGELARRLAARLDLEVHLVLSASTKPRDLERIAGEYAVYCPRKLLFTKLDETRTFGPLAGLAVRTGWALSFLGTGPGIPEDLKPATRAEVAQLVAGRRRLAAAGAAG